MRIIALIGAAAIAAGIIAAAPPAEAQRYGYRGHHGGYGYGGYRHGWGGPRHRYGYRHGYRHRPRWRGSRGWRGYGRSRVVCRGGYYGRRCVRVYR